MQISHIFILFVPMVCHQSQTSFHFSICRMHILVPFLLAGDWYLGRNHLICYFDFSPSWRPVIFWKFFHICVYKRSFLFYSFWIQFLSQRFLPYLHSQQSAKSTFQSCQWTPQTSMLWSVATIVSRGFEWKPKDFYMLLMRVHKASTLRSQAETDSE